MVDYDYALELFNDADKNGMAVESLQSLTKDAIHSALELARKVQSGPTQEMIKAATHRFGGHGDHYAEVFKIMIAAAQTGERE